MIFQGFSLYKDIETYAIIKKILWRYALAFSPAGGTLATDFVLVIWNTCYFFAFDKIIINGMWAKPRVGR